MADDTTRRLAAGMAPLVARVRTDVTAKRTPEGRQSWTREPLTEETLAHHLNGGPARGVCPIRAGESVTLVAVLDFDSHKGDVDWATMSATVARVVDVLELAWGMEPILFRSGGGRGVHLYLLWDEPQDAYSVRAWLRDVLAVCGLKPGAGGVGVGEVEVNPKQSEVRDAGFGSQVILPLARESVPLTLSEVDDENLW